VLNILIADDHPVVRAGLRAVLAVQEDWRVCAEAGDGETLVRLVLELKPDIAIVDCSLPVLSGLEAMRQLQREAPQTRMLVYTMHDDDLLIRDAAAAGAQGYILKSETDETLLAAVAALARGETRLPPRMAECLA
jgi:DNA-binding NarL/FixJ family response regulator